MPRQRRVKKGRGAKVRKSSEITVVKSCRTIKTSAPVSHKGSDWMIREELWQYQYNFSKIQCCVKKRTHPACATNQV